MEDASASIDCAPRRFLNCCVSHSCAALLTSGCCCAILKQFFSLYSSRTGTGKPQKPIGRFIHSLLSRFSKAISSHQTAEQKKVCAAALVISLILSGLLINIQCRGQLNWLKILQLEWNWPLGIEFPLWFMWASWPRIPQVKHMDMVELSSKPSMI